jgi:hypothetical protein
MSTVHQCKKCNKTFSTLSNLKAHLKTVCAEEIKLLECEYCHGNFRSQSSLVRHYNVCKVKVAQDSTQEITLKNEYEILKVQLKTMEDSSKEQKEQIAFLKSENDRLLSIVAKFTEKSSDTQINTNNNTNNTVNINMNLFDHIEPITSETFFKYGQELTQTALLQGFEHLMSLAMKHLKDKIVCTDRSRNTLNYKINDQQVKDLGGTRLAEQLLEQSIEPKVRQHDRILVDTYVRKCKDPTVLKTEQSQLDSMIELRNAIVENSNMSAIKTKIGSRLSKRAITNHAMLADLNGATTENMWEFFKQVDKSKERVLFDSIEYFLIRDANKNVIRAVEVDEDGIPIMETQIDFSEHARREPLATSELLLPPVKKQPVEIPCEPVPKKRGRPRKIIPYY